MITPPTTELDDKDVLYNFWSVSSNKWIASIFDALIEEPQLPEKQTSPHRYSRSTHIATKSCQSFRAAVIGGHQIAHTTLETGALPKMTTKPAALPNFSNIR
jgi:hypothetical protein